MEGYTLSKPSSSHIFLAILVLLVFISRVQPSSGANTTTTTNATNPYNKTTTDFIERSCNATEYPLICFKSLSTYANVVNTSHRKLAHAALTVSLRSAKSTSSMVSKLSTRHDLNPYEAQALKDCVEEIGDSIDELQQSLKAMTRLPGSTNVNFEMSNIETWVSAALTDDDTCMDDFDGKDLNVAVKNKIRKGMNYLAKLTSNALALINNLSAANETQSIGIMNHGPFN